MRLIGKYWKTTTVSNRFRPPKPAPRVFPRRGSPESKMRRYAAQIRDQAELDRILDATPDKHVAHEWLRMVATDLKFVPRQLMAQVEPQGVD